MAKRKVTKHSKRRLVILVPLSIFVIIFCVFTIATMSYNIYSLTKEKNSLDNDLTDLKKSAKELKTEITKLQDKDYVARYARENYLYTKDGEYVIKINDEEEKKETKDVPIDEKYIFYGFSLVSVLIIIYIFLKHKKTKKKKN